MKNLYLLAIACFLSASAFAQFQVTLKVIDNENGALTNKVDDNNETNVFVYASDLSDNKLYDNGDWWYAMYSGEAGSPTGELIKADGVWTWQATFSVAAGDYKWNPHMKTLGWATINGLYKYAESNDILFSVSEDGTITGQTTLELPLLATSIKEKNTSNLNVFAFNQNITVNNLNVGSKIKVINLAGALISKDVASGSTLTIPVSYTGIYLVNVDGRTFKVLVK